jgi:nucleoside-diphosphate-sugar epimerase
MSSVAENTELLQDFLRKSLPSDVRILVNGANGWLGKNISESLLEIFAGNFGSNVLLTGSKDGLLPLQSGRSLQVIQWAESLIQEFEPTHVIQLAFKTRDHVNDMVIEDYLAMNEEIVNRAIWMISLPSLQGFIHTSSGAALAESASDKLSDPYGYLKKLEEEQYAGACSNQEKKYIGVRVWSTTGRYIKTGGLFAIESLISQAISSENLKINSPSEVWRSYADANEILLASLIAMFSGTQGMFNSGGTNVEIGELAQIIASDAPIPEISISRTSDLELSANIYTSLEPSIEQILISHNLQYSDLQAQVINTMQYLIWLDGQVIPHAKGS